MWDVPNCRIQVMVMVGERRTTGLLRLLAPLSETRVPLSLPGVQLPKRVASMLPTSALPEARLPPAQTWLEKFFQTTAVAVTHSAARLIPSPLFYCIVDPQADKARQAVQDKTRYNHQHRSGVTNGRLQ